MHFSAFRLQQAIRNREFTPFYQPIVCATGGEVVGCEMLARCAAARTGRRGLRGRAGPCPQCRPQADDDAESQPEPGYDAAFPSAPAGPQHPAGAGRHDPRL
ncbi:EAL domain-containing protein [Salmonella enterica]|uniref:EAL domain-containing protein n=1 Tax=Salmonella enterica TaxID=28901 RepID=UPI0034DB1A48